MSSEEASPPKRRITPQFDVALKTQHEQQGNATAVTEKIRKAYEDLQRAMQPKIEHLESLDWTIPYQRLPDKARQHLKIMVNTCHVSTLQVILKLIHARVLADFQLWSLLKEVEETLQLGDEIYSGRG